MQRLQLYVQPSPRRSSLKASETFMIPSDLSRSGQSQTTFTVQAFDVSKTPNTPLERRYSPHLVQNLKQILP